MSERQPTKAGKVTVEHAVACALEADDWDHGCEGSALVITKKGKAFQAHIRGLTISGAICETVSDAVLSLYETMIERTHSDRRRVEGLFSRLDARGTDG